MSEEGGLTSEALSAAVCIVDRVALYTRHFPERRLITWVDAKCREENVFTYAEFDESARRLAAYLFGKGLKRGDHVVLAYTPGVDFYLAFWACTISGLIPVPVNPPFSDAEVEKFLKVCVDSDSSVVLTGKLFSRLYTLKLRKSQVSQFGKRVASVFGEKDTQEGPQGFAALEKLRWLNTSGKGVSFEDLSFEPQAIHDPAFIMYSSGSTASPKGALTSFGNMHHQFEMIAISLDAREQPINCWWAPHFHDFGLLSGFLNTLHQGGHAVVTSPMYFIQRPTLWLDMLHTFGATHTFGPDFGYQLLTKRTTLKEQMSGKWDLSSLKVAMSAAEKVREATLQQFNEAFKPCGLSPVVFCPAYGLAEHAVGVTINGAGKPFQVIEVLREPLEKEGSVVLVGDETPSDSRSIRLVGCGTPWHGIDVRIVQLDADGGPQAELGTNKVGEIWVASESKALGYYQLPNLSFEVFDAHLPGAGPNSLAFLRTGDLGFLEASSGELYICGRKKDMVIIGGKNHYSEDLELTAASQASQHVRPGRIAAFSVEEAGDDTEALILVAEVTSVDDCNRREAFRGLSDCIAAEHKVAVSQIVLIEPGTIPKTTSGKLRRFMVREQFLTKGLSAIPGGIWLRPESKDSDQTAALGAAEAGGRATRGTVAIVGEELGSLAAAWVLAKNGFAVTLFSEPSHDTGAPPAFWTFSKKLSPNLSALLELVNLDVPLAADSGAGGVGYFDLLGNSMQLSSKVSEEAARFQGELLHRFSDPEADGEPISELVHELGLSREFVSSYLIGLISPFDPGHSIRTYLAYPSRLVAWMWLTTRAHFSEPDPELHHLEHQRLKDALREYLGKYGVVFIPIRGIQVQSRTDGKVILKGVDSDGTPIRGQYGSFIVGGTPDQARTVLGEVPNSNYDKILSQLKTVSVNALVHRGNSYLPKGAQSWRSINLFLPESSTSLGLDDAITTTLLRRPPGGGEPTFMTYNARRTEQWSGEGDVFTYEHLVTNPQTQRLRYALKMAQGQDGIYFCGDWLEGMSLAEDGIVGGLSAANSLVSSSDKHSIAYPPVPLPPLFEVGIPGSAITSLGTSASSVARDLVDLVRSIVGEGISVEANSLLAPLLVSDWTVAHLLRLINQWQLGFELIAAELYAAETVEDLAGYLLDKEREASLQKWEDVDVVLEPTVSREEPFSSLGTLYPVSFAQESILVSHFLSGQQSNEWNIPLAMWFIGDYSPDRLRDSLKEIARRHSSLRMTFHPLADGTFGQKLHAELPADFFATHDVATRDEAVRNGEEDARLPMDITAGVWRVILSRVSPKEAALTMVVHHAAFDGGSLAVLFKELQSVYSRFERGEEIGSVTEEGHPLQFIDFADWQRRKHRYHQFEGELRFWEDHLAPPLPPLNLADEHQGWEKPVFSQIPIDLNFSKEMLDSLRRLARQGARTSVNVLLMTAYAEVLSYVCGQKGILIRFPSAARPPGTQSMIGCFAEAMVVRFRSDSEGMFLDAMANNHGVLYEAFLHPAPFYLISERLGLDRDSLMNLNRAVLNWEQTTVYTRMDKKISPTVRTEPFILNPDEVTPMAAVQSMLNLHIDEQGSMRGKWFLNSAFLRETTRQLMGEAFVSLLQEAIRTEGKVVISDALERVLKPGRDLDLEITPFDSLDILGGDA